MENGEWKMENGKWMKQDAFGARNFVSLGVLCEPPRPLRLSRARENAKNAMVRKGRSAWLECRRNSRHPMPQFGHPHFAIRPTLCNFWA